MKDVTEKVIKAITDKELAKVIRHKADELNKLLEEMAKRDVEISIGTESAYLEQNVREDTRKLQRVMVYSFSKTEKF